MGQYLDHWKNLERANSKLGFALYGVLALAIIEAWGMVRLATAPSPIYVIPGAPEPGIHRPGAMTDVVVRQFSENYVLTLTNFTPETASEAYNASLRYLSPEALSRVRSVLDEELTRIKRDRVSSHFSLGGGVEVGRQDGAFLAVVRGKKRVYAGREMISEGAVVYRITLTEVPPTETNPYGLQVTAVEQEVEAEERGSKKGGGA